MAIERERKFLVKQIPFELVGKLKFTTITQMYLNEECSLRLRLIENDNHKDIAKLTYKEYINDTDRREFEYDVHVGYANRALRENDYKYILTKKRATYDGWEIDVYPNGLIIAEYEYVLEEDFPKYLPNWIGEELTGVKEYSNIYIAKNWDKLND